MDVLRFLSGVILPYLAAAVFLVAMTYRIRAWVRAPSPPMTLFPAPAPNGRATTASTIKEALLFPGLFKADRNLWMLAWGFHVALALVFVGHVRVVTNVDGLFARVGMTEAGIQAMSSGVGGAAGIVILITALALLLRRFTLTRVKEITSVGDILALVLIAAILITGNLMRFGGEHFDLGLTREYFARLVTFRSPGSSPVLEHGVFLTHMTLAFLLLMYIPFSKILHLGGTFFTHQLIRKH